MNQRAPGSTVSRMIANAMNLMNIEVETGWSREEIMQVARESGYALDAASRRFRRAPQPKPAPPGIVRTSQTSTGAGEAPAVEGLSAPVLPETSGAESVAVEAEPVRVAETPAPEPDPFAVAGAAFAELLRAIALALNADPAVPVAHVAAPKPATQPRVTHGATQSQIRDWARTQGLDVNPRGTVRRDIADAYAAAHRQETP